MSLVLSPTSANILDTAATYERTNEEKCGVDVSSFQRMGELSAANEYELHGPGSKTLLWSAPDSGALFDMDLEGPRKACVLDGGVNEPIQPDPLDKFSVEEDCKFSPNVPEQLECGDDEGDGKPKTEKIHNHHKHHDHLPEKRPYFQNKLHASGASHSRDFQTWRIMEQRHTKSKSILVPKNRRKSSTF